MSEEKPWYLKDGLALVLRTCNADGTSYNGFKWPLEVGAYVEAPDWSAKPTCGGGLHGLLNGRGDGSLLGWRSDKVALVIAVSKDQIIDLRNKVKFPSGRVAFVGDIYQCAEFISKATNTNDGVVYSTATAGYRGTATAGYRGTATAGGWGTATAGEGGTATAGYSGTATAGYRGIVQINYWDSAAQRRRIKIGYVGEDGLKPNTAYKLNAQNNFVPATA